MLEVTLSMQDKTRRRGCGRTKTELKETPFSRTLSHQIFGYFVGGIVFVVLPT